MRSLCDSTAGFPVEDAAWTELKIKPPASVLTFFIVCPQADPFASEWKALKNIPAETALALLYEESTAIQDFVYVLSV